MGEAKSTNKFNIFKNTMNTINSNFHWTSYILPCLNWGVVTKILNVNFSEYLTILKYSIDGKMNILISNKFLFQNKMIDK